LSVAVDTNILLYAVNPNCPEHGSAHSVVEELRAGGGPWYLTWGVIYEFPRVITHPAVSKRPLSLSAALSFARHLLDSPSVGILHETETHFAELEELARQVPAISANDVHDAHTVVLMREHNILTILTADKGFGRFKNLEVVNPIHA
jgi:uncharacterized protein